MDCPGKHFTTAQKAQQFNGRFMNKLGTVYRCCENGYKIRTIAMILESLHDKPAKPPSNPERSCFAKKRYPSAVFAGEVIKQRNFSGRPYSCRVCNGWHITSAEMIRRESVA